jgi:hypothetical protein
LLQLGDDSVVIGTEDGLEDYLQGLRNHGLEPRDVIMTRLRSDVPSRANLFPVDGEDGECRFPSDGTLDFCSTNLVTAFLLSWGKMVVSAFLKPYFNEAQVQLEYSLRNHPDARDIIRGMARAGWGPSLT